MKRTAPKLDDFNNKSNTNYSGHNYSPPLENSIGLHVFSCLQEKYSASPGQHFFMFLVSFERTRNKAINKIFSI